MQKISRQLRNLNKNVKSFGYNQIAYLERKWKQTQINNIQIMIYYQASMMQKKMIMKNLKIMMYYRANRQETEIYNRNPKLKSTPFLSRMKLFLRLSLLKFARAMLVTTMVGGQSNILVHWTSFSINLNRKIYLLEIIISKLLLPLKGICYSIR